MARVVTPATLAQDISEEISFGEILEATQPYQCKLLRRAIVDVASTVIAAQLAGGDVGRVLTVSRRDSCHHHRIPDRTTHAGLPLTPQEPPPAAGRPASVE